MGDEIAAALGLGRMDDEFVGLEVERAEHRDFPRLSGCGNTQIGTRFRPGAGEIGVGQRFAFVAEQQNDVAGFGLLLEKLQTKPRLFDLLGDLMPFQGVPGASPAELFFATPWTIANG
jgi:hypothetical protein